MNLAIGLQPLLVHIYIQLSSAFRSASLATFVLSRHSLTFPLLGSLDHRTIKRGSGAVLPLVFSAADATYCLRLTSPLIGFFPPPPTSLRSTGFILRAFFRFLLGLGMLSIQGSTLAPAVFITLAML